MRGLEGLVGACGLLNGLGDDVEEAREVVRRVLARELGILGGDEDAVFAARVGERGGGEFRAVREVHDKGADAVGAVVDADGVLLLLCFHRMVLLWLP